MTRKNNELKLTKKPGKYVHTDGHKNKEKKIKNPTLPLVNAGPPDRIYVLSTKCGGCHPNGIIVASSDKIKQIIIILKFIYVKVNSLLC